MTSRPARRAAAGPAPRRPTPARRPAPRPADDHDWIRPVAVRRPVRPAAPQPAALAAAACPTRTSTRTGPAATCASRRAPTTRRWPSTRSATWPGSASAARTSGSSWASAARRPPRRPGHATEPARLQGRHEEHQGRATACSTGTCGSAGRTSRGCAAAATWSPGGSGCSSRTGTATSCRTRKRHRPDQGVRRAADRRHRVHPPDFAAAATASR